MRSCLRLKKAIKLYCNKYEVPWFLTKDEWKSAGEIETVPHKTSKLTTIFQNEENFNGAHVSVMRKMIPNGLSCGSMNDVDSNDWSNNK